MPLTSGEGPIGLVVCPSRELARCSLTHALFSSTHLAPCCHELVEAGLTAAIPDTCRQLCGSPGSSTE